jgi:hypothetical protein
MNSYNECKAITELDLDPIKVKLMHGESGEGWSLGQANAVELEYRRFLYLMKTFPNEQTAPLADVDTFWHYHILDTVKYAADCEEVFGYFLHHFPYIGLRGEADEEAHHRVGERMRELYEQTFGEPYRRQDRVDGSLGAIAFSGANVNTAFSGANVNTAFSGANVKTAFSGANVNTAFSGANVKTAFSGANVKTAFSGANVKTAFSGANVKTAFSGANVKTAFSGVDARSEFSGARVETLFSGSASSTANPFPPGRTDDLQHHIAGAGADSFYTTRPRLAAV